MSACPLAAEAQDNVPAGPQEDKALEQVVVAPLTEEPLETVLARSPTVESIRRTCLPSDGAAEEFARLHFYGGATGVSARLPSGGGAAGDRTCMPSDGGIARERTCFPIAGSTEEVGPCLPSDIFRGSFSWARSIFGHFSLRNLPSSFPTRSRTKLWSSFSALSSQLFSSAPIFITSSLGTILPPRGRYPILRGNYLIRISFPGGATPST